MAAFALGDRVKKVRGYKWPGIVVSVFRNLAEEERYVVECTVPEVDGALHIYNAEQLELDYVEQSNHSNRREQG